MVCSRSRSNRFESHLQQNRLVTPDMWTKSCDSINFWPLRTNLVPKNDESSIIIMIFTPRNVVKNSSQSFFSLFPPFVTLFVLNWYFVTNRERYFPIRILKHFNRKVPSKDTNRKLSSQRPGNIHITDIKCNAILS